MKPIKEGGVTTQQILRYALFIILLLGAFKYAEFQSRNFISGPEIVLTNELETIQHERIITLQGMTKNITSLTLNGKPIFTDEEGAFSKTLVLENGYTIMTLQAKDRFGRNTNLVRPFVYTSLLEENK